MVKNVLFTPKMLKNVVFFRKICKLGIELININQTYTNHLTFVVFYVKMVKIDFEDT